jgi:hypothetical protein
MAIGVVPCVLFSRRRLPTERMYPHGSCSPGKIQPNDKKICRLSIWTIGQSGLACAFPALGRTGVDQMMKGPPLPQRLKAVRVLIAALFIQKSPCKSVT